MITMQRVHIRWGVRRDMPTILDIDALSYATPWSQEEFLSRMRERNCILFVATRVIARDVDEVLGYMLVWLHKHNIEVSRFAVHPAFRRRGIGSEMIAKLRTKLSHHRRTWLSVKVPETALEAQLFLRESGFVAIGMVGQEREEILFQWRLDGAS